MLKRLIKSLETCPIVKRGDYNYFIHPITDGVPSLDPALLREVATAMIKVLDLDGVDRIIAAEAMAIPVGSAVACMTDIPLNIVRKRQYFLPGEIPLHQVTGYSKGELYLNGVNKGDRVVIVDDVITSGNTMHEVVKYVRKHGGNPVAVLVIFDKRGIRDVDGVPVYSLFRISRID